MSANVKIGANSSDFQKQMSEMTRQLKTLGSQFNLSATKAKLFGNSTDQLKVKQNELTSKMKVQNTMVELQEKVMNKLTGDIDKQKNKREELSKKIEETTKKYKESVAATGKNSEKSKELKEELSGLKEKYAQNERAIENSNKKLDNAEIKMNKSKKALLENKKALEEVNKKIKDIKLDKVANGMKKTSDITGKISSKMKPLAIGITGAGAVASKFSLDFKDGLANINTLLDNQSHLDGYKNKITEVSNQTGMDIKIVTDGMYQAISSIGDGGKETEKIFDTMSKGAKAGGAEVKDSVALISAGMKGYGQVNDETAKKISDLAFQTAKLGVTTFPEMASSMQPLFPLASGLNVKMTDLYGSMATLTGVTGNTSEVSTQLEAVFSNLMRPTTDMQKVMKKYGYQNGQAMIKAKGLGGVLKIVQKETGGQSDKMAKLFSSTKATTAMTALCGKNFNDFTSKTKEMEKATGSTDRALAKINKTAGNDLRTSLNEAKNSMIGFGDVLSPFISLAAKGISGISKAFSGLSEGQKKVFVGIGAGIVGFTGLFFGVSKVTGAISEAIINYKKIRDIMVKWEVITKLQTAAQTTLNFVMNMNPIALVVIAIAGLIAGLVLLYKHCKPFHEFVDKIGKSISAFAKSIPAKLEKMKTEIIEFLKSIKNKLKQGLKNVKAFFTQTIPNFFKSLIVKIKNLGLTILNSVKHNWQMIKNFFTKTIPNAIKWFLGLIKKIQYYIGFVIGKIVGYFVKGVKQTWNFVTKTIPKLIANVVNWFKELPGKIWSSLLNAINKIEQWGSRTWNSATKWISKTVSSIIDWFVKLPGRVWSCLLNVINKIEQWGSNTYTSATNYISKTVNSIIDWFSKLPGRIWNKLVNAYHKVINWGNDLWNAGKDAGSRLVSSIVDTVSSIPSKMLDIGKNIVHGIWQGITGAGGWIKEQIGGFCSGIVDGFKSALGIHSPALKLYPVGDYTIQGVDVGMKKAMPNLIKNTKDKMLGLAQKMKETINGETPTIGTDINSNIALTALKPNLDKAELENMNAKLNRNTTNNIYVIVENTTTMDGEVVSTKVYKKVARKIQGDKNTYKVTKGSKGGNRVA